MTYYALMMIPSSNVIYLAFVIPNGWCWFPCWLFGCHWYLVGVDSISAVDGLPSSYIC